MGDLVGYAFAAAAAVSFGVQYVPVKKYEIFDGTTFQWFMCNGILMVGLLIAIATGDIQRGVSLLCMMGGALWALSNYIVIPLVKLLGIGMGFSLYHFVNLVVGYCVGRFGLFGLPKMEPKVPNGLWICDCGCLLLLIGFTIMVFVETGPGQEETRDLQPLALPPPLQKIGDHTVEMWEYRQRYRQWRLGEAQGPTDRVGKFLVEAVGMKQRGPVRFVQFGLYADPQVTPTDEEEPAIPPVALPGSVLAAVPTPGAAAPSTPPTGDSAPRIRSLSEPNVLGERLLDIAPEVPPAGLNGNGGVCAGLGRRVFGVLLAVLGGVLCGVNNVPPSLFTLTHPGLTPFAAVFSQCLGIWMVSSLIYLAYSSLAKLNRWPVPHSAIRPAYMSGCIWAVGFACMLAGIKNLGYSVGYTLDAVGPVVVSSLISIFVYKEISGARQLSLFALSFVCQLVGVSLIAGFGRA